jgi:hypothetical protein
MLPISVSSSEAIQDGGVDSLEAAFSDDLDPSFESSFRSPVAFQATAVCDWGLASLLMRSARVKMETTA